jgi:hypothetical protein
MNGGVKSIVRTDKHEGGGENLLLEAAGSSAVTGNKPKLCFVDFFSE